MCDSDLIQGINMMDVYDDRMMRDPLREEVKEIVGVAGEFVAGVDVRVQLWSEEFDIFGG